MVTRMTKAVMISTTPAMCRTNVVMAVPMPLLSRRPTTVIGRPVCAAGQRNS
jgi:hypothetical protein